MPITYMQAAKALGLPEDTDHAIIDAKFREIGEERKTELLREKAAEIHGNPYAPRRVSGVRLHAEAEAILARSDYSAAEYAEALEQAEAKLGPEAAEETTALDDVSGLEPEKVETLRQEYISRRGTELVQARWGADEQTATYDQLSSAYAQAAREFETTLDKATGKETSDG